MGYNEGVNPRHEAVAALDGFVGEVIARFRVPPGRARLGGFSQGGAMRLRYGLPRPQIFAGVAVLSGSLRRVDDLLAGLPTDRNQPIFVAVDPGGLLADLEREDAWRVGLERSLMKSAMLTPGGTLMSFASAAAAAGRRADLPMAEHDASHVPADMLDQNFGS